MVFGAPMRDSVAVTRRWLGHEHEVWTMAVVHGPLVRLTGNRGWWQVAVDGEVGAQEVIGRRKVGPEFAFELSLNGGTLYEAGAVASLEPAPESSHVVSPKDGDPTVGLSWERLASGTELWWFTLPPTARDQWRRSAPEVTIGRIGASWEVALDTSRAFDDVPGTHTRRGFPYLVVRIADRVVYEKRPVRQIWGGRK
jgi:hypothetical protein